MPEEQLAALQSQTVDDLPTDGMPMEEGVEQDPINEPAKMSKDEQSRFILKAERRFRSASNAMGEKHKMWKILDQFDRGEQWKNVQIPVWIPKPMTNLIRYVRTTKRANLAQNVASATFVPMTPLDIGLVTQIQKAYDHVWDEQKVPLIVRKCVDRGLLHGTSIAYVYAEQNIRGKYYGDQNPMNMLYEYDVRVKKLGNANFYIDPTAYCLAEVPE